MLVRRGCCHQIKILRGIFREKACVVGQATKRRQEVHSAVAQPPVFPRPVGCAQGPCWTCEREGETIKISERTR